MLPMLNIEIWPAEATNSHNHNRSVSNISGTAGFRVYSWKAIVRSCRRQLYQLLKTDDFWHRHDFEVPSSPERRPVKLFIPILRLQLRATDKFDVYFSWENLCFVFDRRTDGRGGKTFQWLSSGTHPIQPLNLSIFSRIFLFCRRVSKDRRLEGEWNGGPIFYEDCWIWRIHKTVIMLSFVVGARGEREDY